jgi:hypothetical protein
LVCLIRSLVFERAIARFFASGAEATSAWHRLCPRRQEHAAGLGINPAHQECGLFSERHPAREKDGTPKYPIIRNPRQKSVK